MRSDDVDTLQLLVNAATDWRSVALTQSVTLDILVTRINGEIVMLEWDADNAIWQIRTADSVFTLRWVIDATNPANSAWTVVSQ